MTAAERKSILWEVGLTYLGVLLAIRLISTVAEGAGWLRDPLLLLVPVLFIWAPVWVLRRKGVDPDRYPLSLPPLSDGRTWRQAAGWGLGLGVAITLPFLPLYHFWQTTWFPQVVQWLCVMSDNVDAMSAFSDSAACRVGVRAAEPSWTLPAQPLLLIAYHFAYVAIPEEMFYRGYMQSRFDEIWPPHKRVWGALVGRSLWVTALWFALGHSLVTFQWWHPFIFVPALAFGWLRSRTGEVLGGAFFHAWCNVMVVFLDTAYGLVAP